MKRHKQRRAYLKRFSSEVVNTGGAERLDKFHMRELYGDASMIGTPERSKQNSFAQPIPKTLIEPKKPWQSDRFHGVSKFKELVIYDFGHKKLSLFFCGNECFWRKEHKGKIQISMIYETMDRAYLAYGTHKIVWSDLSQD